MLYRENGAGLAELPIVTPIHPLLVVTHLNSLIDCHVHTDFSPEARIEARPVGPKGLNLYYTGLIRPDSLIQTLRRW